MKNQLRIQSAPVFLGMLAVILLVGGSAAFPEASLSAPNACVAGPHTGDITTDEQWCLADSPHTLSGDVTVLAGVTLTIEPGVTIRSAGDVELLVKGHLISQGTAGLPILFTSSSDSAPGQWSGLVFDGGTGHLSHATLRYAGQRNRVTDAGLGAWARSTIAMRNVLSGEVRLENVTIRDIASINQDMGIYVQDSNLVAQDSLFTGVGDGSIYIFPDTPIYISGAGSDVTLTNNTFTANNYNSVVLKPGAMMGHNATLTRQIGLDGYVLQDDFTLPLTITLTIDPGVTLRDGLGDWDARAELHVLGHLEAIGTPTQPITFTSFYDNGPTSGRVWYLMVALARAPDGWLMLPCAMAAGAPIFMMVTTEAVTSPFTTSQPARCAWRTCWSRRCTISMDGITSWITAFTSTTAM